MITRHKVAPFLRYFFQPKLSDSIDDNTYGRYDGYVCTCTYVFAAPPGKLPGLQRVEVLLYQMLKRKSATDFSPHPVPSFHLPAASAFTFRQQRACNAILMMEVSSVSAAFTPRYEARVYYTIVPVTLFHDLNCIDCVTSYNNVVG